MVNRWETYGRYLPPYLREPDKDIARTKHAPLTPELLQRHYRGEVVIGLPTTGNDGLCRWLVIDVDRHGDEGTAEANEKAAVARFNRAAESGLEPLLEDSNGRGGFHLWMIFSDPVESARLHWIGRWLVHDWKELGLEQEPEIFPKQARLVQGRQGNWVRLFGKHHTLPHWSRIWDGKNWVVGEAAVRMILACEGVSPSVIPEDVVNTPPPAPSDHPRNGKKRPIDPEQVRSALAALPTHLCDDYETWIKVGMCLSELHEVGLELWKAWSQRSSKYRPGECEAKWRTFKRESGLTVRSLFFMARDHGWRRRKLAAGNREEVPPGDASRPLIEGAGSPPPIQSPPGPTSTLPGSSAAVSGAAAPESVPPPQDIPPAGDEPGGGTPGSPRKLPVIIWNSQQPRDVTEQALDAIRRVNTPPRLFQHGNELARLRTDGKDLRVEHLNWDSLRGHLARVANWGVLRISERKDRFKPTPPMDFVVRDILSLPAWAEVVFPRLEAVVRSPVFSADGDLISEPGYHPRSRLYYAPQPGLIVPPVPREPSDDDVTRAKALLLEELFADFPFQDKADRANALAYLLTPLVRQMITGPTPMGIIEAPAPGTGKGLLAACITTVILGSPVGASAQPENDAEWRKAVSASLAESPQYILFDNLTGTLRSPALEEVLTADVWSDRILGVTLKLHVPVRCVWLGTANNLQVAGDLPRRLVWVRLDAKMEFPEARPPDRFRHPRIVQWAQQNRGELLWSALVLAQAWVARGKPAGPQALGSYESWAETVGGILQVARVEGFLANAVRRRRDSDDDGAHCRAFCLAWWHDHGQNLVGAKDLFEMVKREDLFPDVLSAEKEQGQRQRLGRKLAKMNGRCFAGFQVIQEGEDNSSRKRYRLEPLPDQEPPARDVSLTGRAALYELTLEHPGGEKFAGLLDDLLSRTPAATERRPDGDDADWEEFCYAWWHYFGEGLVAPKLLRHVAETLSLLPGLLHGDDEHSRERQFEEALAKMEHRNVSDFQIVRDDEEGALATDWYRLKVREGRTPPPRDDGQEVEQDTDETGSGGDAWEEDDDLLA